MKRILTCLFAAALVWPAAAQVRGKIDIPNLKDFVTLKCDFHIHTVFSDGNVWPTVRIAEAYREGLDAISITDHIEYRPYSADVAASHNRSFEIAEPAAKAAGIILIRGSEITRAMPPGHLNAIFLTDCDQLEQADYMDALRAAQKQGAFIFWNHPGWDAQQPDTTLWWPEHTKIWEQGLMHGIEVVNGSHYYPEAHRWCLEKNLTMIGTSDVHDPIQAQIDFAKGGRRSMTLVFAREASAEGIHEALVERRTAIYSRERLIGQERFLKELFEQALDIKVEKSGNSARITIKNNSDLTFRLKKNRHDERLVYFRDYTIVPQGLHVITVRFQGGIQGGDMNFSVENLLTRPNQGMDYTIKL
ncbi:MAG: Sb-PDE family phosphodiesterase [Bacteroidales bacterium]|nr:Sb-PDE family phosphodiesterase [Bacteroidales bacterium]MCL2738600.1 Sb-PDE family phosphodiesterase [Bacteroidales bacterium]